MYEALKLDWVDKGTGTDEMFSVRPAGRGGGEAARAVDGFRAIGLAFAGTRRRSLNRFKDEIRSHRMPGAVKSLSRFLDAQAPVYAQVVNELAAARKTSHWMWFIFPQIRGPGRTSTAWFYGIASRAEAVAYWQHPVLGGRLKECAELVLAAPIGLTSHDILGTPDDLKLRSSMTLFAAVAPDELVFGGVLARFHEGKPDEATLALLV